MLKYQQLVLTLTFLSFDLIIIEAEKAKFNLKGHQAPEYASGPNGTMTNDRSLKQNGSFKRLNEDPEGNETDTNPTSAVIWSLSNDQLIMIRK